MPQIQFTGAFRTVRRTADNWEVFYKNFRNDLMVLVSHGLSRELAEELKESLNAIIYQDQQEVTKGRDSVETRLAESRR